MTFIANDCLLFKQTTVEKGLFNKPLTFHQNNSRSQFVFFPLLARTLVLQNISYTEISLFQDLSLFEISIRLITSIRKVLPTKVSL